ncbi:MAG TPA: sigma-70 family RNA polymerase sigma factor [Candidatus Limnocylindrales bacterium]|nr:sigma-70 family RNA polymerase sigma factor [Candidatus Limnocylindrales bacterium]
MDRELLERARAGDREAFELIVVAKGEPLFRTALAILGNEADARDATQEAFVSCWRSLSTVRDVDRFDAWLGRILINECRMTLRQRRRIRELMVQQTSDGEVAATPAMGALDTAESGDFDAAFGRLSVDQRAILVLHHLHGYGVREIGAWLGIPSGTVKWRLSRARSALRGELAGQGES